MFAEKKRLGRKRGARGSPGKRLYAVGDVHGCLKELETLLYLIEADHAARPVRPCHIVFLGDLVDRGPDTCGVIRRLMETPPDFADLHFICGNHEEMMLRCLSGETDLIPSWLAHGGHACAISYGVDPALLHESDPARLEHVLLARIPKAHIDFLSGFLDTVRFGDYCLVHAGIRPGIRLSDQKAADLRWIRADFITSEAEHEAVIVHGHTPCETVERFPNRIGVDTGAYMTGNLSAIRIEDDDVSVISTIKRNLF